MKALGWAVSGVLAVALTAFVLSGAKSPPRVVRIIDGDTIEVSLSNGRVEKVRYIGIDTPELRDKPLGELAKLANKRFVDGKNIRMERDVSERDRFGRLLRYVYVGETLINAELVREGQARAKDYPPDTKHSKEFHRLQSQARKARRGLWSTSTEKDLPPRSEVTTTPAFIGNANTKKLHDPTHDACADFISQMDQKNKIPFKSLKDAESIGYELCFPCGSN